MPTVVQDRYAEVKARFQQLFEAQQIQLNGHASHPYHQFRKEAMKRLEGLNFPTRRDEEWKYTSVNRVLQPEYQLETPVEVKAAQLQPFLIDGLDAIRLVFVNGAFREELSDIGKLPEGLTVMELDNALADERFGEMVQRQLDSLMEGQEDPFMVLNAAFARHGLFIHVARNTVVEKPVYLIHLAAPGEVPTFSSYLNIAFAEQSSEASFIEGLFELPGAEGAYFNNLVNRFRLKPNSHIHHYRLQQEGREGFLISNADIEQDGDSTYSSYAVDLGGRLVRNNLATTLNNQGTGTNFYGTYFAKGEQHIDNHTFIDHAMPHCQSNELYKGILTDKAHGVFNGKVLVRRDAQKTNAFQQNSSLVLSDKAQMDSKPQLEIFADDVRCSHGATIGQLDETAVFYLRSRGLSDEQARAMLQHAFLEEVIEFMKLEPVKDFAEQLIMKKFEE
ncbi:MAG: Fe-S cluster assembly protein SufD [Phaeodactylibacter sp.]|nr:Fe-S cluster assembly protein SufD [Phaeodactylibacter sp.]MCB9264692.1 Fe-S cluster assembly protein SufD [Lewinellaceae bacterium]MCB9287097.1 Fe-S cluster assembly protein SufD [Lewinellaceae bacterium]